MKIPGAFTALKHRNFRLYFSGQLVSLVGTWMQSTAQAWLVYRLTHSPFLMGLTGFISLIPAFLFGIWGGVVADRCNRHKMVIITQILEMAQAFLFAIAALSGNIQLWQIFVLAGFLGFIHAFDMPLRQAFVVELVESESLSSGIALNSSIFNGARIVGPALAGLLVSVTNEGYCFLINGFSYFAVLGCLAMIKIRPKGKPYHQKSVMESLKDGFDYVYKTKHVRSIFFLLSIAVLCGSPYLIFMPIYANDILHSGAGGLGILMGTAGAGAFLGAISVGGKKGIHGLGKIIGLAVCGFGIGLIVFAFSKLFILSIASLLFVGFSMMCGMVSSNIMLQHLVPDHFRGRLMSFYSTIIVGVVPLGSLIAGWMAKGFGVENTTGLGGILAMAAGLWFLTKIKEFRKDVQIRLDEYEKAVALEQKPF